MRITHRWKLLPLAVFAALFLLMVGCSDDSVNGDNNANTTDGNATDGNATDGNTTDGNNNGNNNNNDAGDAGVAIHCDPDEDPSGLPENWCLECECEASQSHGKGEWMCWAMVCPMDGRGDDTSEPEPECREGDTQTLDCNSCFCSEEGTWNCTTEDCGGHTEPCEGLTCGDACTICADDDPDCVESDRNKFCSADGQCEYTDTPPECSETCREGDTKQVDCNSCICDADGSWGCSEMDCSIDDFCDGLSCGDRCSTCDLETDVLCPDVMEYCDEDGLCSSETPACI